MSHAMTVTWFQLVSHAKHCSRWQGWLLKGYPMKLNKFAQMHLWADILTDNRNGAKKKLEVMQKMILAFDADTRDHFRAALTEVLRSEKIASVRHEAIKQLGIYFSWSELEWTWWLHYKRFGHADTEILSTWEWYVQNKKLNGFLDAKLLYQAVKEVA
jgi:hypothetical protein